MNLDGIPVQLIDTAGIREAQDPVERIGVLRARQTIENSDLVLLLLEASARPLNEDLELLEEVQKRPYLIVRTKMDCSDTVTEFGDSIQSIVISAETGDGMQELKRRIRDMVMRGTVEAADGVYLGNIRQKQAVGGAIEAIRQGINTMKQDLGTDLVSSDLQRAYDLLGELTGNSVREDLTDEIFSRFCLGK